MRTPFLPMISGAFLVALGTAGLIRGAVAQPPATTSEASAAGPIAVTNAYVRAPVPPSRNAAAYFTIYNTTATADRLLSVETGAGHEAVLHTLNPDGSMSVIPNGVLIHAHSKLVLATGKGHVMIEHVYGTLSPGQTVDLELDFQHAGPINVVAPVIAVGAPAPGGGH
jgi:hypothetical protein